jgi:hypothetical protein
MMKLLTSLALVGSLIALAGCGDDGRRITGDGGTDGSIVLMDGGGGDSSTRPDSTTTGDSSTGTCPPVEIPDPTMAVCSADLIPCIQACPMGGDDTCFMACFEGEDPNCEPCLNQALGACYTTNGCAQSYGDLNCCATDSGCATTDTMCIQGACAAEITAFQTCQDGVDAMACGPHLATCIMM